MRPVLITIAVLGAGLAACATAPQTAQVDLPDACVFSGPGVKAPKPHHHAKPAPEFTDQWFVNGRAIEVRYVETLKLLHRDDAEPGCGSSAG